MKVDLRIFLISIKPSRKLPVKTHPILEKDIPHFNISLINYKLDHLYQVKMSEEKLLMFRNRLMKVFRHVKKLAKRQGVSSYRIYDHDLPEFPFCIEIYEDKVYLAEYQRRHGMTDEEHVAWLESCVPTVS